MVSRRHIVFRGSMIELPSVFTAAVDEATPVDTVDGKNPAPVEVGTVSHYLQGFVHPRWLAGFLNHQQHDI